MPRPSDTRRDGVSPVWMVGIVLAALLAAGSLFGALLYQRSASAPVGEGELFRQEALAAEAHYLQLLDSGASEDRIVRMIRNDLRIEAVGLVDRSGLFIASTAPEQVGVELAPFLASSLDAGRFAALAVELTHSISIDGVNAWSPGAVVYQVVEPVGDGALVLSYDISELLARRSQNAAVRPLTIQLAIAGILLGALAIGLGIARVQAKRRLWESHREAELLAARSRDLEAHNRELEAARKEAERALALAEETNRIRSEFVLMINHELRTPLTSVVTGAEILMDQPDMPLEERMTLLRHLVEDGRRLVELMSQMLTVARVENRNLNFSLTEVPAREILGRLTDRFDWLDVSSAPNIVLETDPDALTQLVLSLADNARSHGARHVRVSVAEDPGFEPDFTLGQAPANPVYVLVADDGPGIDHDFLPRAFEKFEKRGRSSGTGLGLYFVRLMAEAIDGYLTVATSSGGTTVAVGVPASRVLEEAR